MLDAADKLAGSYVLPDKDRFRKLVKNEKNRAIGKLRRVEALPIPFQAVADGGSMHHPDVNGRLDVESQASMIGLFFHLFRILMPGDLATSCK